MRLRTRLCSYLSVAWNQLLDRRKQLAAIKARRRAAARRHQFDRFEPLVVLDADPVANNDDFTFTVGQSISFSEQALLSNDTDADPGDHLSVVGLLGRPKNGSLTWGADGNFTFTPTNSGFHGVETLRYVVADD